MTNTKSLSQWVHTFKKVHLPNGQEFENSGGYFANKENLKEGLGFPNVFLNPVLKGSIGIDQLPSSADLNKGLIGLGRRSQKAALYAWARPLERKSYFQEAPYLFNFRVSCLKARAEELLETGNLSYSNWHELIKLLKAIEEVSVFIEKLATTKNKIKETIEYLECLIEMCTEIHSCIPTTSIQANAYEIKLNPEKVTSEEFSEVESILIAICISKGIAINLEREIKEKYYKTIKKIMFLNGVPEGNISDLWLPSIDMKDLKNMANPQIQSNTPDDEEPELADRKNLIPSDRTDFGEKNSTTLDPTPMAQIDTSSRVNGPEKPRTPGQSDPPPQKDSTVPRDPTLPGEEDIKTAEPRKIITLPKKMSLGIEIAGLSLKETLFILAFFRKRCWTYSDLSELGKALDTDPEIMLDAINDYLEVLGKPLLLQSQINNKRVLVIDSSINLNKLMKELI